MSDEELRAKQYEAATRVYKAVRAFAEEHPDASAFEVAIVAGMVAGSYHTLTVDEIATGIVLEEWIAIKAEREDPPP